MMKKYFSIVLLAALISACANTATAGFYNGNTVGHDVDEVITNIKNSGLFCGEKFIGTTVLDKKKYGGVNCGFTQKAIFCPTSHNIFLSFDLLTNKVKFITKDERDNCF